MIANYHTHTPRCRHARGGEREYIACAQKRGLKILGFSDHSPQLFPGDYYSGFRMRPEELEGYLQTVQELKKTAPIELHLGVEIENYPHVLPRTLELLRDTPLEYLILGQHFLGDEMNCPYCGQPTEDPEILRRFCDQSVEGIQMGIFTYLAHPDLLPFMGDRKLYEKEMSRICREAKACGVPLEINLLGLRDGRAYPNPAFWALAAAEGCQVILGCDAHEPEALLDVKTEKRALRMIRELGLELIEEVPLRDFR